MHSDEYFMKEAIKEAKKSYIKEEVPVGCVIVLNNKIISRSHNLTESKNQVTAHAEILAINKANKKLKNWRLNDCILYTTLEPCSMCLEVIKKSRLKETIFLLKNKEEDFLNNSNTKKLNNKKLKDEFKLLISNFFYKIRGK